MPLVVGKDDPACLREVLEMPDSLGHYVDCRLRRQGTH